MGKIYLTKSGREQLIQELERLQKRKSQVSLEIERAREHGDLRENAEYHAAKETLTNIMKRIGEINMKLGSAQLIDNDKMDPHTVYIGATVTILDDEGDEMAYTIVDGEEADPMVGKISIDSPMGQGLLGHKVGETVTIALPGGESTMKLLKIER